MPHNLKRTPRILAEKAEKKVPGCTLSSWLEKNYTHVTLTTNIASGGKRLIVPQLNVELTIALVSTDCIGDWSKVARHWAPVGTIIDKVPMDYYVEKKLLLQQLLTKELLLDDTNRTYKKFLEVLERRDAERWAAKKQGIAVKATATAPSAETGDAESQATMKVEFEIV